jgi:hypothetical protein
MRVCCLNDRNTGELLTFEITDIGYDDDIEVVCDECVDSLSYQTISGLYVIACGDVYGCIKNLPLEKCNEICKEILKTGYFDLSEYGEIDFSYSED